VEVQLFQMLPPLRVTTLELDYPPTDPNFPIEVRNAGALLCYFPVINAVGLNFGL